MPKGARVRSLSGYYHVVPKGIADQILFEDDGDRRFYLELLSEAKQLTGIRIHAYCLMSNHVHLVIEDPRGELSSALKHVHEHYGSYFAKKIGRGGGIFRRPFWSEPIEDESRLLCAVRYVHANPEAASICDALEYEWSSVQDYLGKGNGLTDTEAVLEMLGGREGFLEFSRKENSTALPFAQSRLRLHLSDDEAQRIAFQVLGSSCVNLASADESTRRSAVRELLDRGFGVSQLSRICGIGRDTIRRHAQ